jgi:hypothetical protein
VKFNRDQWIESFEGQLALLRPHLPQRVLTSMALSAWHEFGAKDEEPITVAKALHQLLEQPKKP